MKVVFHRVSSSSCFCTTLSPQRDMPLQPDRQVYCSHLASSHHPISTPGLCGDDCIRLGKCTLPPPIEAVSFYSATLGHCINSGTVKFSTVAVMATSTRSCPRQASKMGTKAYGEFLTSHCVWRPAASIFVRPSWFVQRTLNGCQWPLSCVPVHLYHYTAINISFFEDPSSVSLVLPGKCIR